MWAGGWETIRPLLHVLPPAHTRPPVRRAPAWSLRCPQGPRFSRDRGPCGHLRLRTPQADSAVTRCPASPFERAPDRFFQRSQLVRGAREHRSPFRVALQHRIPRIHVLWRYTKSGGVPQCYMNGDSAATASSSRARATSHGIRSCSRRTSPSARTRASARASCPVSVSNAPRCGFSSRTHRSR